MIRQVPADEVVRDWQHYVDCLNRVIARTDCEYGPDDILTCVQLGEMQMWRYADTIGVTQLQTFPRYRQLLIYAVAGEKPQDWMRVGIQQLEDFALSLGCSRLVFHGRLGWQKHMRAFGYEPDLVVMRKVLHGRRRTTADTDDKERTMVRAAAIPQARLQRSR